MRLILPGTEDVGPLPVQFVLGDLGINTANYFPHNKTAEVSRFAISREIRQRYADDRLSETEQKLSSGSECRTNLPCLGLVQILVRMSLARGIIYWAALMEPKLLRMLATMGIYFNSVGSLVSHHGLRQPSFCHVPTMLEQLRRKKPDHWDIVSDGGALSYINEPDIVKGSHPSVWINRI